MGDGYHIQMGFLSERLGKLIFILSSGEDEMSIPPIYILLLRKLERTIDYDDVYNLFSKQFKSLETKEKISWLHDLKSLIDNGLDIGYLFAEIYIHEDELEVAEEIVKIVGKNMLEWQVKDELEEKIRDYHDDYLLEVDKKKLKMLE